MHIYAHLRRRTFRPMQEAIEEFFLTAIMDPNPTPTTNPLLWWLVVLIQSEVLENQARLPIPDLVDHLDFPAKLEALDHYSRALILDHAFQSWCNLRPPLTPKSEWKEEVVRTLDKVSLDWVDEDRDPPSATIGDHNRLLDSPAWSLCCSHINHSFDQWLTDSSSGPMREIINLSQGTLPQRSEEREMRPERVEEQRFCYRAMMHITEYFTIDPVVADCYPAHITTRGTAELVNTAAREALECEFGSKSEAYQWDEVS
ncbi:hypothetical protein H2199_005819 [Coniosporium tulheliwenetii]|uniref:Uncharacterized protein n=1 Tax=Coniosporium tulheliwenetii TaxID=3383036 RepID=A0ACC2YY89_9PEZI|nr:hypothetical protein H2199_005819 [Cladosporium sp. JES 115]